MATVQRNIPGHSCNTQISTEMAIQPTADATLAQQYLFGVKVGKLQWTTDGWFRITFTSAQKYDAHINVEICSSITAVKYLFKYVYKGHDRINAEITSEGPVDNVDEIRRFVDARYVSVPSAAGSSSVFISKSNFQRICA